jgi:hypothetical protein
MTAGLREEPIINQQQRMWQQLRTVIAKPARSKARPLLITKGIEMVVIMKTQYLQGNPRPPRLSGIQLSLRS